MNKKNIKWKRILCKKGIKFREGIKRISKRIR
jgi:hypothetical protein